MAAGLAVLLFYRSRLHRLTRQLNVRFEERLAERTRDPRSAVSGIHLEGPFLSPAHAGVHPVELLRAPADGVPGHYDEPAVRMVTLAPELRALMADLGPVDAPPGGGLTRGAKTGVPALERFLDGSVPWLARLKPYLGGIERVGARR